MSFDFFVDVAIGYLVISAICATLFYMRYWRVFLSRYEAVSLIGIAFFLWPVITGAMIYDSIKRREWRRWRRDHAQS